MQAEAGQQLQHLQEQVYYGKLGDEDRERLSTYFYDLPGTSQRRNRHIYPSKKTAALRIASLADVVGRSNFPFDAGAFLYPRTYLSSSL